MSRGATWGEQCLNDIWFANFVKSQLEKTPKNYTLLNYFQEGIRGRGYKTKGQLVDVRLTLVYKPVNYMDMQPMCVMMTGRRYV